MNKPLFIVLACLATSCGIQKHTHAKIDIAEFNAKQIRDTVRLHFKRNIEVVETRLSDGSFLSSSTREDHAYSWFNYYYPSGKLKTYTLMAHGFKFGKSPLYNENGDLISITDNDIPFKYSMKRLSAKFAFGYGLDIFKKGAEVTRSTDNNHPLYRITIPFTTVYYDEERHFVVDGITGKVLSDETTNVRRKELPANTEIN